MFALLRDYSSALNAHPWQRFQNAEFQKSKEAKACHQPLADVARVLCLHGISKDAWDRYSEKGNWYYEVTECGFKYNLSDIQSAIGIHQLRKQERFVEMRTRFAEFYNRAFGDMPELELPPDDPE